MCFCERAPSAAKAASAAASGAAHADQGVRGMALLAPFGAHFSLRAFVRRSRRACIFALNRRDSIAGPTPDLLCSRHIIRGDARRARFRERKNSCLFFHHPVVFLLTLALRESIHSSTAITIAGTIEKIVERENSKMATKKAAKKAPAKKAAKKTAKKK
jgi:hypothetical protein